MVQVVTLIGFGSGDERAEGAGELKEKEKGMAPVIGADCGDGKGRGGVLG